MRCHKCGSEISGEEYRMVAQWPFCLPCFEQLLNKPAVQPPAEQPPAEQPLARTVVVASPPGHPEPSTKSAQPTCVLCEKEITDGTEQRFASWVFCPTCFATFVALSDDEEPPAEPRPKKSPFSPPTYVTPTSCKGCGRRIPERGGKEVGGELYCPDCYGKQSRSAAQGASEISAHVNVEAQVDVPHASTAKACESCGREGAPGTLQAVEGFGICAACLSTDADLALHLARKRHQLYLERLKKELA